MKVEMEIPDGQLLELAREIIQNYPEYSFCLQCVGWNYEKGVLIFEDEEEDDDGKAKRYSVTVEEIAAKGLPLFINAVLKGEIFLDGMEDGLKSIMDPCCWDAISTDAVIQFTIFGKVIYG